MKKKATKTTPTLLHACSQRGADMGRINRLPVDRQTAIRFHLQRLPMVDGDYDRGGAYWGHSDGTSIYCAFVPGNHVLETEWHEKLPNGEIQIFRRETSAPNGREAVMDYVRTLLPNATFYREGGVKCRTCGKSYSEAGDGWDGECPSCADKTAALESVESLTAPEE